MKQKILALGLSVGAFALIGCGGSVTDELPAASGTIDENATTTVVNEVIKTGFTTDDIMAKMNNDLTGDFKSVLMSNGISKVSDRGTGNNSFEGVQECGVSGTREYKIVSGENPYANPNSNGSGKVVFKKIFDNCSHDGKITEDGTVEAIWNWIVADNGKTWTNKYSYTTSSFISKIDDTHKFTVTSGVGSGEYTHKYGDDFHSSSSTRHSVMSGKLVNGDKTAEYKNITRDRTYKEEYKASVSTFSKKWEVSGAIKRGEFGGWIIIATPTPFEKNEKDKIDNMSNYCYHAGKLTVSGKAHTVSKEVHSDHSITIKYDNNVIKEYTNCLDYKNGK